MEDFQWLTRTAWRGKILKPDGPIQLTNDSQLLDGQLLVLELSDGNECMWLPLTALAKYSRATESEFAA